MLLSINPYVIDSIALWKNEAIVYHPFQSETNHLDAISTEIIKLLLEKQININDLIYSLQQKKISTSPVEYTEQLVHSYVSELLKCEIIIKC